MVQEEDEDGGSGGYCLLIDLHKSNDNDLWCNKAVVRNDIFYAADQTEGGRWPVKHNPVTRPKWHDWRDSRIEIIAIDMTNGVLPTSATKRSPLKSWYAGDGVVRLYREQEAEKGESEQMVKNDDGTVVAILAIPSYFTPSDILGFVGNKAQQQVSHFRMIKTESANRFMVLIKFRTQKGAQWFLKEYNGKLFSSMEAETCQVVLVNEIKFFASAQVVPSEGDNEIPYMLADTFTSENQPPAVSATATATATKTVVADAKDHRPDPPPPSSLKELPTCPVCLERMDTSVTGLMTILCQHTFHCQCLSKWGDGSCPVCRYTQRGKPDATPATCDECHSGANPWVCLVCGHVGCGRYDSAHAYSHYVDSSHCYVMEVATQRVWDYASDSYVHRLIQDPTGKLVETSGNSSASTTEQDASGGGGKKQNDELALQYTHLLSSQLDSQRQYFEEMMKQAADRASEATGRSEDYERDMKAMNVELVAAREAEAQAKAREKKLQQVATNSTKSLQDLTARFARLENDYKSEQAMSKNLSAKVTALVEERSSMKEQIVELDSQLKDIMFYLDAQSKLKDAGEDVQEGTVIVKNKKKGKRK